MGGPLAGRAPLGIELSAPGGHPGGPPCGEDPEAPGLLSGELGAPLLADGQPLSPSESEPSDGQNGFFFEAPRDIEGGFQDRSPSGLQGALGRFSEGVKSFLMRYVGPRGPPSLVRPLLGAPRGGGPPGSGWGSGPRSWLAPETQQIWGPCGGAPPGAP
ncbi:autophagy protein APG9, putative, partial [Eimeria tenella]